MEEGESLASVARLFNLTASQLATANDLKDRTRRGRSFADSRGYHEAAAPVRAREGCFRRQANANNGVSDETHNRTAARHRAGAASDWHCVAQLKVANRSLTPLGSSALRDGFRFCPSSIFGSVLLDFPCADCCMENKKGYANGDCAETGG